MGFSEPREGPGVWKGVRGGPMRPPGPLELSALRRAVDRRADAAGRGHGPLPRGPRDRLNRGSIC